MTAMRHMKIFAQVAGNKQQRQRKEDKIEIEVNAMVVERRAHQVFLEEMVRELEEQYRIELRKKAILKHQCDQAYLRGVSAIGTEALKMSNSTLEDYYRGMKQQGYDGKNIHSQMKNLQMNTMSSQIHEDYSEQPKPAKRFSESRKEMQPSFGR